MKEIILVAGKDEQIVGSLRQSLREQEHKFVVCETLQELPEKLKVFFMCDIEVSLIVVDSGMLETLSNDLLHELSKCAANIPFIVFDTVDTEFSFNGLPWDSLRSLAIPESTLSSSVFRLIREMGRQSCI